MSTTDSESNGLSDERLGRMVMALRRHHFSNDEINEALGFTDEERRRKEVAFSMERYRNRSYGVWTCELIDNAWIHWANANGRWPLERDMFIEDGLPSPNVARYHRVNAESHWCRSEWNSDENRYMPFVPRLPRKRSFPDFWERIAMRGAELKVRALLAIPNLTIRREAVVQFGGIERIVREGGARYVQSDDYGILWSLPYADESWERNSIYVEVINSTVKRQEIDGVWEDVLDGHGKPVYDHYFLRVPPHIRTAREAVAWTGHFDRIRWDNTGRRVPAPNLNIHDSQFDGFVAQS